jgi:hypothetical protein
MNMIPLKNMPLLFKTVRTASVIVALATLVSCASFSGKSNDDKLAKLAGETFVLSVAKTTLNLDLVTGEKKSDQSIFRLVSDQDAKLALTSNGNRKTGALKITDTSTSILNSLSVYFKKKYQLRFVAKGTINNIDPEYIARALKKGNYLIDIRVSELNLIANAQGKFYLQSAYQFTVIDRKKGKLVIQDHCVFAEPQNAQSVRYFSDKQGQRIAEYLKKYANDCLRYFAQGTPLKSVDIAKPVAIKKTTKSTATPKPTKAKSYSATSFIEAGLGGSFTVYPGYTPESLSLFSSHAQMTVGKSVSNTRSFVVKGLASAHSTTLGFGSIYGGTLGLGMNIYPSGDSNNGYQVLANGRLGQFRQNGVLLSTNALGVGIGAYRNIFGDVYANASYNLWLHTGKTEESNLMGHDFGVSLSYRFH